MAANRNFASGGKIYSMHVMPVLVDVTINIGATGAVTSISGQMVTSVVRNSTGTYQINLTNNFNSLLSAHGSAASPSSGLSGILAVEIQNAGSAAVQSLTAPHLIIKTLDAAGALADPASGSAIRTVIYLSNSSVQ